MKVVDKNLVGGKLVSITCRIEGDYEKRGFRALPGLQTCPHCGKKINPKDEDMLVIVPTPLEPTIPGAALDLGMARTKCSECGQEVSDPDQCDLMSFPEIISYVSRLRKAYELKRAAQKGGAK